MAVSAASITAALVAAGTSAGVVGASFPLLAQAIGSAVSTWIVIPSNVQLSGVTAGALGVGAVAGTLVIPPSVPVVQAALTSANVSGLTSPMLASVIANGVSSGLSSAQYVGVSPSVAVGTDNSVVILADYTTLVPLIAVGLGGASSQMVSLGIALAISSLLLTSTGVGSVTGTPTSGVGAGISSSVVI